ncbi:hypothetical protein [Streptomyces sp. DH37]|uniref:hypothetical protein n=1 Tax=Streptomyces sp. DH37 TaxID=3040122 RepID=UPI0024437322|nr:hypothetical protein [Streptomyces sp. DH37]MDG9705556.1 hypothetical protein [Streptomyces sp. DH37]
MEVGRLLTHAPRTAGPRHTLAGAVPYPEEAPMHRPTLVNEIRDLAPTEDGWAQHEPTGRACTVCTCGLDTGFVDKAEASRAYAEHAPAGQIVRITPDASGADEALARSLKQLGKLG